MRKFLALGGLLLLGAIIFGAFPNFFVFVPPILSISATLLIIGFIILWGSLAGKLRLRDKILNNLKLQGNEKVLDVGCGSGLMLIGAAKRLTKGKAIGIDIWQTDEQTGNSAEKTRQNVKIEKVEKKIEIKTADAKSLPFPNESFEIVVSSWALHNLDEPEEREKALLEIIRVLKKGGKIAIADIRHGQEYAEFFAKNGLQNIEISRPYFLFISPTLIITANK